MTQRGPQQAPRPRGAPLGGVLAESTRYPLFPAQWYLPPRPWHLPLLDLIPLSAPHSFTWGKGREAWAPMPEMGVGAAQTQDQPHGPEGSPEGSACPLSGPQYWRAASLQSPPTSVLFSMIHFHFIQL